ncbi:hypothetical protein [Paracoccus mutanolyticus]|uniref:hypothetical protein n=1 Tax=Paracoccus mutanolyticus TaxID=1499308 RepID=UPI001677E408|nr:hypothetical protein [Paracoccus mutanolyticus]
MSPNLERALETRELLNQSQRQTEELQAAEEELLAQQEELQATNAELACRTGQLEETGRSGRRPRISTRTASWHVAAHGRTGRVDPGRLAAGGGLSAAVHRLVVAKAPPDRLETSRAKLVVADRQVIYSHPRTGAETSR